MSPRTDRLAYVACLTALLARPAATRAAEFGVAIHDLAIGPAELDDIKATGFRWVRIDFTWSAIEASPGRYDFRRYDEFVARLTRAGLKAVAVLDYGNPLHAGGQPGGRADTAEFRAAYARWAAATVGRYAGKDYLWEIWNEPNGAKFWPPAPSFTAYIALARAAGAAIRAAAPAEKIAGPAVSGIDRVFLEACCRAGLLAYWSSVSVHPYRRGAPDTAAAEFAALRALIAAHAPPGREISLLVSEWGYSTAWPGCDEARQAENLTRVFALSRREEIPVTIWYDWRDDGPAETGENRFGLMRNRRDGRGRLVPKPAWQAARDFLLGPAPAAFVPPGDPARNRRADTAADAPPGCLVTFPP